MAAYISGEEVIASPPKKIILSRLVLFLKPPIIIECYPFYLLVECSSKICNAVFGFNFRRSVGVEFHLITFALMNNKSKRIYLLQFNTRVEFYSTFLRCQLLTQARQDKNYQISSSLLLFSIFTYFTKIASGLSVPNIEMR